MNILIFDITNRLKRHFPVVNFKVVNDNEFIIFGDNKNGYDTTLKVSNEMLSLTFGDRCNIYYENTSKNRKKLLNSLCYAPVNVIRIRVHKRNGREYKWTFQSLEIKKNIWHSGPSTSISNYKFWQKKEIEYWQNNLVPFDKIKKTFANNV